MFAKARPVEIDGVVGMDTQSLAFPYIPCE